MIEFRFVALTTWPHQPCRSRKYSPFRAGYSDTLQLLDRELRHLRAKHIVIQADCDASMVRIDGQLRSGARLRGPGVIVSFESPKGAMSFPCDTYTDWQANIRAIAMSLEALRAVDRYGVTQKAEQYRGWTALPDKSGDNIEAAAAAVVAMAGGMVSQVVASRDSWDEVRKRGCATMHPDRFGDDGTVFKQFMEAAGVLDRHHKV